MQIKMYLLMVVCTALSFSTFAQSAITEKEIAEHISFLASPKMAGRFPGTKENRKVVNYLIKHFKQAGIKPYRNYS